MIFKLPFNLQIQLLMNNYTHPSSEYVNHILNRSPSKATYTFSKAERFSQLYQEDFYLKADYYPQQHSYEQSSYRLSPKKQLKSPIKNQESNKDFFRSEREYFDKRAIQSNVREIFAKERKDKERNSKSKSPCRCQQPQSQLHLKQHSREKQIIRRHQQSPPKQRSPKQSPKKSPRRDPATHRYSPNRTFTQYLHDIDHVSKNITINGYYPTGIELTAGGKTPNSKYRNTQSHTFNRSSSKQRYNYVMRSDDELGPGYYDHFSEFGPAYIRK